MDIVHPWPEGLLVGIFVGGTVFWGLTTSILWKLRDANPIKARGKFLFFTGIFGMYLYYLQFLTYRIQLNCMISNLFGFISIAFAYNCQVCDGDMCCNQPSDGNYYLTSFCDGGGHTSCGDSCSSYTYFTADRQRFGCHVNLDLCRKGKCLTAIVTDAGPANWVENDAGGPIIDASPQVCSYLTGGSSCGWSDHFVIHVTPSDNKVLGPRNLTQAEYDKIIQKSIDWHRAQNKYVN